MANNTIICPECGCPYDSTNSACPECGAPNNTISGFADIRGYATECSCCGAPSNGFKMCQWCGSAIQYIGQASNGKASNNRTILECEFKRIVNDRNLYSYIICHVNVNGHELMQVVDNNSPEGMKLSLFGVQGSVFANFQSFNEMHSFYSTGNGVFNRAFGIDYPSAAATADDILRQVYEVTSEQVSCNFEYGQVSNNSSDGNVAAAAIGGVLLGALFDDF